MCATVCVRVSESVTQQQLLFFFLLFFPRCGTEPSSGHFTTTATDESAAFYLSHHGHSTPVSHHYLLSLSVNGTLLRKQYLSDHLAGEIQSNRCALCSNLVAIFLFNVPRLPKIALLTLRTKANGVAPESRHTWCRTHRGRTWSFAVVRSTFSWKRHCKADEHPMGCFMPYAWVESDLHNYALCNRLAIRTKL